MRAQLSIACVSNAEPRAASFLEHVVTIGRALGAEVVFGAHGQRAADTLCALDSDVVVAVEGEYLEQMLNPVIQACSGEYVLRLDDDEKVSSGMFEWLKSNAYLARDSWFFARYHLWPDVNHVLVESPFFPDFQQRLMIWEKSQRGETLHSGSPWPGYRAPCYFEHHNFLVKSYRERQEMTAKYETIKTGKYFDPDKVNVVWPEDAPANRKRVESISDSLGERARLQQWWNDAVTKRA